jgi:hypothetical protein
MKVSTMFKKILSRKFAKLVGGGLGTVLAAIGGLTSIQWAQPAVEKASDYGARVVDLYCELPAVDRQRFRVEVRERLASSGNAVTVSCAADELR